MVGVYHASVLSQRDGIQKVLSNWLLYKRPVHVTLFTPKGVDQQLIVLEIIKDISGFLTQRLRRTPHFVFIFAEAGRISCCTNGVYFQFRISKSIRQRGHRSITLAPLSATRCWNLTSSVRSDYSQKRSDLDRVRHIAMYFHEILDSKPFKR